MRFIDQPAADQPVGIYGVAVAEPLAAPQFVTDRLEESTASPRYLIETSNDTTVIERRSDGERWTVPAGGRNVFISPDEARIAWAVTNSDDPPASRSPRCGWPTWTGLRRAKSPPCRAAG